MKGREISYWACWQPTNVYIHTKAVLKGVYKTIEANDQVILWGGGIWEWFDPITLIQALTEVVQIKPQVKLFFLGTQHPQADEFGIPRMRMAQRAYDLAQSLNLLDRNVFFNDWVPYDQRQNYLLEADIGVSFHQQTLETHYSFRTRILDYIWAGLPIIANEGDTMAELIKQAELGRVVPSGDVQATKGALLELLHLQPSARLVYRNNFERIAATMSWEQNCLPLVNYCQHPKRAPDYEVQPKVQGTTWGQRFERAQRTLREEGPLSLTKLGYSYLKWRLTR
jgi:glycosyltransferase involved in cell wall biosynthesis